MTTLHVSRRRAAEFDSLVEGSSTMGRSRHADALELVSLLRAVEAPEPRPEFVASLREELMTAADSLLVATPVDRSLALPRRTHRERRIAAVVGGAAILGATTSVAMAAQSALPGDMLYPVKRAIENAHAGVSVGDDAKGSALLANASGRLDEVSALSAEDSYIDGVEIADTLNAFTEQASEASDLLLRDYAEHGRESSIVSLRDFTAESMDQLARLQSEIPSEARNALVHAARVLTQIDVAAERVCPSCAGAGIQDVPARLASGGLAVPESPVVPATTLESVGGHQATKGKRGHDGGGMRGTQGTRDGGGSPSPDGSTTQTPSVPQVEPGASGPSGGGTGGGPKADPQDDPVKDLTEGLTGGGGGKGGDETASLPSLPGVDDVTEDLTDPLVP